MINYVESTNNNNKKHVRYKIAIEKKKKKKRICFLSVDMCLPCTQEAISKLSCVHKADMWPRKKVSWRRKEKAEKKCNL